MNSQRYNFREGSFLHLAYITLGDSMKEELSKEYERDGIPTMAKHWGFCQPAIRTGLRSLGIQIKRKPYKINYKAINLLLKSGKSLSTIASAMNCSRTGVRLAANKLRWRFIDGQWRRKED